MGSILALGSCQRQVTTPNESGGSPSVDSVVNTATNSVETAASVATVQLTSASSWAIGAWRGAGAATVVKVELPGNQGVQLAWVQDKGNAFVGPIDVNLELNPDGTLAGQVRGSLGELRLTGNWDGEGALEANLSATTPAPDAFNGMLTVTLSAQASNATATLRVISNDGRWVRQALVSLAKKP